MFGIFFVLILATVVSYEGVQTFPKGAPIEACIYNNHPNHPGTKPEAHVKAPFTVTASSSTYHPGQTISVKISGSQDFKGFFVQAVADAPVSERDAWIGEFVETPQGTLHSECSAITHSHPGTKNDLVLTWKAPFDRSGNVYFLATVLESYNTYWVNMVAKSPPRHF